MDLSSVLLNLRDRLSDYDRERFDLYLQNGVSTSVEDHPTLGKTLELIHEFIDQDQINDQDFPLLIDAFEEIRCFDAVHLLKEHQYRMLSNMMPVRIQQFIQNDDDEHEVNHRNTKKSSLTNGKNKHAQKKSSSPQRCFCVCLPSILFLLTLGILIFVLIKGDNCFNNLMNNLRINQDFTSARKNQTNQKMHHLNKLLSEKNATVEQLNRTLIEMQSRRNTSLIIAGQLFGEAWGDDFDDSALSNFTSSHYLSEILFSYTNTLHACQFIYTSSRDSRSRIESNIHGSNGRTIHWTHRYYLNAYERIKHVQVKSSDKKSFDRNDDAYTKKLITGLTFTTMNNRTIPYDIALTGDGIASEEFSGYTLGYITGKSRRYISQFQFFWYRTEY